MQVSDTIVLVRTKSEASDMLGVTRQTIHNWEKDGRTKIETVDHEWLLRHLSVVPDLRHDFHHCSHAYLISGIPNDVDQKLSRYRSVRVPVTDLPGYEWSPDTLYSIREAGIRLKEGILRSELRKGDQDGYSRSYLYGIMGNEPGQLKTTKLGRRRFITEEAIREYEQSNNIPGKMALVHIFEPNDSPHWEVRTPGSTGKKAYNVPKVLYFKPFKTGTKR